MCGKPLQMTQDGASDVSQFPLINMNSWQAMPDRHSSCTGSCLGLDFLESGTKTSVPIYLLFRERRPGKGIDSAFR